MRRTQVCLSDLIELAAAAPCSDSVGGCGCHGAGSMPPKCFYWNEIVLIFLGREAEADQAEAHLQSMLLADGPEPRFIAYAGLMEAGERVSPATVSALANFRAEAANAEVIERYLDHRAMHAIARMRDDLSEAEHRLMQMLADPQSEHRRRLAYKSLRSCTCVLSEACVAAMQAFESDPANRDLVLEVEEEFSDSRG